MKFTDFSKAMAKSRVENRTGSPKDCPVCKECGVEVYHKFIHKAEEDANTNLVTCDMCYEKLTGIDLCEEV